MDMKKSLKRINVFLIFSLLISTVTVFYFFYNADQNKTGLVEDVTADFSEGWQVTERQTNKITVRRVLPQTLQESDALSLKANSMAVQVRVGGRVIKEHGDINKTGFELPFGNVLLFAPLAPEDVGSELEITFAAREPINETQLFFDMYIGPKASVSALLLRENLSVSLYSISCVILCVLFVAFSCALLARTGNRGYRSFLYFSLFVLLSGIWMETDTDILQWITGRTTAIFFASYLSFMLLPPMIFLFLGEMKLHCTKVLHILCWIHLVNLLICLLLHLCKVVPLTHMIVEIHALMLVSIVVMTVTLARERWLYRSRESMVSLAGMGILGLSVVISVIQYYLSEGNGSNSAIFRFGLFLFVLLFSAETFQQMAYILRENEKAERYRQYAYLDALTGLFNRRSFEEELKRLQEAAEESFTILMFDINGLKEANDHFGHSEGDLLIINGAKCIQEAFVNIGLCFRIGGDEFAVVAAGKTKNIIDAALSVFRSQAEAYNGEEHRVPLKVACGVACKNPGDTIQPEQVFHNADAAMYRDKAGSRR